MKYDPKKHHRKSIRLKHHDYSSPNLYFITLCCHDRKHLFGKIINGEMILNKFGEIVQEQWEATPSMRPQVEIHEFIIMPDHFHAIIEFKPQRETGECNSPERRDVSHTSKINDVSHTSRVMGECDSPQRTSRVTGEGGKGKCDSPQRTSRVTGEGGKGECDSPERTSTIKIWQRNYFEKIIRNEKAYKNITKYIKENPGKWSKK